MRLPRLLLLLAAFTLLVAFGVWRFVGTNSIAAPVPESRVTSVATVRESAAVLEAPEDASASRESNAQPADEGVVEPFSEPRPSTATHIRGRVVRAGSSAPVSGLTLTCVLEDSTVEFRDGPKIVRDALNDRVVLIDGGVPVRPEGQQVKGPTCTSDSDGRFEFEDLVAGMTYKITGEAPAGMRADYLPRKLQPSDKEVFVLVRNLYTAHLVATESNGAPFATGDCQFLRYAHEFQPGECAGTEISREPKERARCDYAFVADCEVPRLGPFKVLVVSPGYQREDHEFWAYPDAPNLSDTELRLHLVAQGTGTLLVRQDCSCTEPVCAHMLDADLDLEPMQPELFHRSLTLRALDREQSLERIPAGIYHVHVRATQGDFTYPALDEAPIELEIGTGQTVLRVPVSHVGALSWKLRDRGSDPLQGFLRISGEGMRDVNTWSSLNGKEAVEIRGLREGPHRFVLYAAQIDDVEGGEWRSLKALAQGVDANGKARARELDWELQVDVKAGVMKSVVVHGRGTGQSGR